MSGTRGTRNANHSLETRLVHAGEPNPRIGGAVSMPVFQTAMYTLPESVDYHDVGYIRLNNTPNHKALHEKLASLENTEAALVAASGMAAITTALFTQLERGDHVLAHNCLYGGTSAFFSQDLPRLGIETDFIDAADPGTWESKLRPSTKVLYVESITNPLIQVGDLVAAAEFARAHGLVSMIDSTFATPINFRPAEIGFDLVLHSATKYLNGHADIVGGAVAGRAELVDPIKKKLDHFGGSMDPHACMLLQRGMKTLALRVARQNESAMALARHLEAHPAVDRVHYPGLESHPHHARAKALFSGFGGMLSFEPKGGVAAAKAATQRVEIALHAPSLGGLETLVSLPRFVSHSLLEPEELERIGLRDHLVRVSVGIEGVEDLKTDFDRALA